MTKNSSRPPQPTTPEFTSSASKANTTPDTSSTLSAEYQVAVNPLVGWGLLVNTAKNAGKAAKITQEVFNKTSTGRALEESKPYRQRLKSLEKFMEYLEKRDKERIAREKKAKEAREQRARNRERFALDKFEESFTSAKPPTNPYDPGFFGVTGPKGNKRNVGKTYDPHFNSDKHPLGDKWDKVSPEDGRNTGGTISGKPASPQEASYNAAQGGPADDSTGSDSFSGEASDFGKGNGVGEMGIGSDTGGGSGSGWGVPVVLDLDGDGFDVVPLSRSTARFDIAGTGRRQVLAWVGPDDGLLVYDKDGDRVISDKDEIAFADYLKTATTDLEGLAWFDQLPRGGNEDGVLDGRDAKWSKFGVWRDTDQDGETDPAELRMTDEGGLTSVNLTSDQTPQDAGPDAKIFGQGEYQFTDEDGELRSGDLYDTALRYEPAPLSANPTFLELYYHIKARDEAKGNDQK